MRSMRKLNLLFTVNEMKEKQIDWHQNQRPFVFGNSQQNTWTNRGTRIAPGRLAPIHQHWNIKLAQRQNRRLYRVKSYQDHEDGCGNSYQNLRSKKRLPNEFRQWKKWTFHPLLLNNYKNFPWHSIYSGLNTSRSTFVSLKTLMLLLITCLRNLLLTKTIEIGKNGMKVGDWRESRCHYRAWNEKAVSLKWVLIQWCLLATTLQIRGTRSERTLKMNGCSLTTKTMVDSYITTLLSSSEMTRERSRHQRNLRHCSKIAWYSYPKR